METKEGGKMKLKEESIQIDFDTKRTIRNLLIFCIAFELFLVGLDAVVNYGKFTEIGAIRRLCNIAREDSLASWFGTTQTFVMSLTVWLIALVIHHLPASKKRFLGWCLIAAFFTYMAVDDGAEIHERVGTAFEKIVNPEDSDASSSFFGSLLDIFPSYAWQILFIPLFGGMGLFILIFLWGELQSKTSRILITTALALFAMAVVLDFIEGLDKNHKWNIYTWIKKTYELRRYTVKHFAKSLEETIEMMGITFFWVAFIDHLAMLIPNGLKFVPRKK